jgi:hypothetical protein
MWEFLQWLFFPPLYFLWEKIEYLLEESVLREGERERERPFFDSSRLFWVPGIPSLEN